MILINLLPHREVAKKKRKEKFAISVAVAAVFGCALAGLIQLWFQGQVDEQSGRNQLLEHEIQKLDKEIADIASLRGEIQALKARQEAVENLQSDRNTPVHLLSELVAHIPDGVYLQSVKQEGQVVHLSGMAQSQERVSELLRNFSSKSQFLTKPELIEIVSNMQAVSAKEQKRVAIFTVKLELNRPQIEVKQ